MFGPVTKIFSGAALIALAMVAMASSAFAQALVDYQMWHQPAASPGQEWIEWFDVLTFKIITPITLFVTVLLGYAMIRFRASANPVPSKTTHNTLIEVIWTVVPILILIGLSVPSLKLLSSQFHPPKEPTVTIKATGYQWYWGYEYQGENEVSFESRLIGRDLASQDPAKREEAKKELASYGKSDIKTYPRLLVVDNEVVVPVNEVVRVLVTAGDVIHNWAMPAFGMKMDGIPGRLNETFFMPTKEGLYYGQCSELCGRDHSYMPIAVRVVSAEQYAAWLKGAADDLDKANRDLIASVETAKKNVQVAGN